MSDLMQTETANLTTQGDYSKVHIEPSRGWVQLNMKELWKYRELMYFLTWRDVKVRYKQTALGAVWAIINPLMTMIVFSLLFGKLGKTTADGFPLPIFIYTGSLPWQYFASSLTTASNSLVGSAHLITKVYFPRLIVPASGVLGGLVDFAISFLVLLVLMLYYRVQPTLGVLLLPVFLLLAMVTALGVGLWLSALNAKYRDVHYIVPFLTQLWFYATPIVYESSWFENPIIRTLVSLNPMVGVVEGFRWALLASDPPRLMIAVSSSMAVAVLLSGAFYFRRMEKTFADVI